nr:immunoglobulin heavy chain junction region [Mus musculus]
CARGELAPCDYW